MIHFFVHSVEAGEPAEYVRGLIQRCSQSTNSGAAPPSQEYLDTQAANVLASVGAHAVPVMERAHHPSTSPEQEAEFEGFKRKARMALSKYIPLGKDETVQEEFYSVLQAPFLNFQPHTPTLRRKTNQAVLYYFDHVELNPSELVVKRRVELEPVKENIVATRTFLAEEFDFSAGALAKGLAGGLISGALGSVGALIFNSIFPPGTPSYFGEVYKEMTRIFKQELKNAEVDQIDGRVNGVKMWVKDEYTPRKQQASVPRSELLQMVSGMVDRLYIDAMGPLMSDAYKKCGLAIFPMTAGMHLALIQEQALVDPHEPDPLKSSYATSVKQAASTYAQFLRNTFHEMRDERLGNIVLNTIPSEVVCTTTCHNSSEMWWVKDLVTGDYTGTYANDTTHDHQRDAAVAKQNEWRQNALNKLIKDLSDPEGVASTWDVLQRTPVPQQTHAERV